MTRIRSDEHLAPVAGLGEELAPLRLLSASAVERVRSSLAHHGQLSPVAVFDAGGTLQVIDGFKRLHAARALELDALRVQALDVDSVGAKAAVFALNTAHRLSEIEEGFLVRSLYRSDRLDQAAIGRLLGHDKSWVCRRLALVESLDVDVQADLHLGVLSASAAREIARLPRGNQRPAVDAVLRRGLTAHQTAKLVQQILSCTSPAELRAALSETPSAAAPRRDHRRSPLEQMLADIAVLARVGGRLQARLLEAPLAALGDPADLARKALLDLHPVLIALARNVQRATGGSRATLVEP